MAVAITATGAHAQQSFSLIGSATNSRLLYFINPTTGQEYRTVDLNQFNSVLGNTYTSVNGLAYDSGTQRIYFATTIGTVRDTPAGTSGDGTTLAGDGGLYYYNLQTNTVVNALPTTGLGTTTQGAIRNADNAAIYRNGNTAHYYWVQDQEEDITPNLYRVSITAANPTVETLQDFNGPGATGVAARDYYNFGDIAIDGSGRLHGSFVTDGNANAYFNSSAAAGFTATGYSESAAGGLEIHQLAYNWSSPSALGNTLYGQNSSGGAGTNQFFVINQETGAQEGAALFNGIRTYNDLTSAPLFPTPAPPGVVSGLIGIAMGGAQFGMMRFRKRRRAKNEISH